ncbi:MAG: glycosyltransferase [Erythrobacter sp.]|nr:glycosyltransferase [Erythrobacter sp.]
MRIAYFINSVEGGGAQSPLPIIVNALQKGGADVRVFALTRRNGKAIPRLVARGVDPVVRDGGEADHLAALSWIKEQAREWNADAIWTSLTRATLLGQIAGAKLGVPVVSWQHNAFLKPWNERLLKWRADKSVFWVADSAQVADITRERLGVAPENLVTWPIFAADPQAPQSSAWKPGEVLRLGSLGRLHPAKGYDFLVDALAILQSRGFEPPAPYRVEIAGSGEDEAALRQKARDLGVENLEFSGFADDPAQFLAGLHLYLQPSRREGFCIAAHEAMQAGLPVIVSRTGEMPYTVNNSAYGRTVAVGDIVGLANALEDMLSRPDQLHAMGIALRDRVQARFSHSRFDEIGAQCVERLREL